MKKAVVVFVLLFAFGLLAYGQNTTGTTLAVTTPAGGATANFGDPVTLTATVVCSPACPGANNGAKPSGVVAFFNGANFLGTRALSGAANSAVFTTRLIPASTSGGSLLLVARYVSNDAATKGFLASSGTTTLQVSARPEFGFSAGPTFSSNNANVVGVAVADFNNDGIPDVLVGYQSLSGLTVYLGNKDAQGKPDGTYQSGLSTSVNGILNGMVVGDFDGDGKLDVEAIVPDSVNGASTINFYQGTGAGQFINRGSPLTALGGGHIQTIGLQSIAAADFYGTGVLALAVGSQDIVTPGHYYVLIYRGNGDGSFVQQQNFTVANNPSSLTAGDFDRSGHASLVVGSTVSPLLLPNAGAGPTAPVALTALGASQSAFVITGDFTVNGKLGIATGGGGANTPPYIYPGQTSLSALEAVNPVLTTEVNTIFTLNPADFNGDGITDLLAEIGSSFDLIPGSGNSTFAATIPLSTGTTPSGDIPTVIADLNGDHKADIVYLDATDHIVSILFGAGPEVTAQTVNSVQGGQVTVGGTGFVTGDTVQLYLSGVASGSPIATTVATATSLSFAVPASPGTYTLKVIDPGAYANGGTPPPVTSSNTFTVNVLSPPVTTGFSPSQVAVSGPLPSLIITGTNFRNGDKVFWTIPGQVTPIDISANATVNSPTSITVANVDRIADPNNGGATDLLGTTGTVSIVVQDSGVNSTSSATPVTIVGPPAVRSVTPGDVVVGSPDTTVTIAGSGFLTGNNVQVLFTPAANTASTSACPANTPLAPANNSTSTSLTVTVPAACMASAGPSGFATFVVQNILPNGGGTSTSTPATRLTMDLPTVSGLSQSTIFPKGFDVSLTVNGTRFVPPSGLSGSQAYFCLNPCTAASSPVQLSTVYQSGSNLAVTIPKSLLLTSGTQSATITVENVNGDATTQSQSSATLTIVNFAISNLVPSFALVGSQAFTLTVNGFGFAASPSTVVQWTDNNGVTTTLTNVGNPTTTQLRATVTSDLLSRAYTAQVSVISGGSGSTSVPFDIVTSNITAVAPGSAIAGSPDTTIVISGTNFQPNAQVLWNNSTALTSNFINSSTLAATVPAALLASPTTIQLVVINPSQNGNTVTPAFSYSVIAPTLSPLPSTQNSAPSGSPGFVLNVTGSNFLNTAVVRWNNGSGNPVNLSTTFTSSMALSAVITPDLLMTPGTVLITVANDATAVSNGQPFTVGPSPSLTSLSPSIAPLLAGSPAFQLTVNGTNFQTGSVVNWLAGSTSTTLSTSFVSTTQLVANVPANLVSAPGSAAISVTNNPGGLKSNSLTLTIDPGLIPTITSVSPPSSPGNGAPVAGGAAFTLTVAGTNFLDGAVVNWFPQNGSPQALTTFFVSPTQLAASVPAALIVTAGTVNLGVTNPGGGTSAPLTPYTIAPPNLVTTTAVQPAMANTSNAGDPATPLEVDGTNFVSGAVVQWVANGATTPLVTVFNSSTVLNALIPSSLLTAPGVAYVTVQNPDKTVSNPQTFTIKSPTISQPTINLSGGLSQQAAAVGSQGFQLTVNGTNYVSGAVVQWNPGTGVQSLFTTFVNAQQLVALVPANLLTTPNIVVITVQNPDKGTSNGEIFTISPVVPTINQVQGLDPNNAQAGSPPITINVNGTNFVNGSAVQWNSGAGPQALTTGFVSATQLTALIPAAFLATGGAALVTVQNPDKSISNSATFTINAVGQPTVTGATPAAVAGGPAFQLTVTGTNFVNGSTVQWNGGSGAQPLTTTFTDGTHLSAFVPANLIAAAGTAFVSVQNPDKSTSNAFSYPIGQGAQPSISSLNPTSAPDTAAGGAAFQLTVNGNNFVNGSVVQWNASGTPVQLATTFTNSGQLIGFVPSNLIVTPGNVFISVMNPGGAVSGVVPFNVTAPGQTQITSISPSSAPAGSATVNLQVNGQNFASGAVVQWNGVNGAAPLVTGFVSATQLTAIVPANLLTTAGTAFVLVQNPDKTTSNAVLFTISNAAVPTVTKVNPSSVVQGSPAFVIMVQGSNFVSGSAVQWNTGGSPQGLATTFLDAGDVTAVVPASLVTTAGSVFISVLNPGGTVSNLVPFTVATPAQVTISLDPATAQAGSGPLTINVNGANLVNGDVVQWNTGSGPQALTTGFVNSTQLTALIPANLLTTPGTAFVSVLAPDKSTSNTATFAITAVGQPTITALTPASATAANPAFQLAVTGTNFVNGSTVQWNNGTSVTPLTTTFVDSGHLTAFVPANLIATASTSTFVSVQNPDKSSSVAVNFPINSPQQPSITPPLIPNSVNAGGQGFQLTLNGANFVNGAVVQWSSGGTPQPLLTSFSGSGQLTALVPANLIATAGNVLIGVQNPSGALSNQVPFAIVPPGQVTISGLSPAAAPAGSPTLTISVSGTNFVNGAVVQWNPGSGPQPLSTGFLNATSLTAVVPAALLTAVGTATVTVMNPDKSQSNPLLFTINPAAQPNINALNPASETAGNPAFQLTVNGANFVSGAIVQWVAGAGNPQSLTTNFTSASQLTALVPANLIASAGTVFIIVQNPDKGTSNQFPFTINPPAQPTITSLSPPQTNSGGPALQLTVSGTNFVTGSVVQWNNGGTPQPLATTVVSPTQLVAVVPANLTAAAGNAFVTVANPSGAVSAPATFAINTPGQATITLNPSQAVAGSATTTISVAGSGFQSGSIVQWNGGAGPQPLATGFVSSAALTAVVPSSLLTTVGTAFVTVLNPDKSTTTAAQFSIIAAPTAVIFQLSPSSTTAGGPGFQLTLNGNNFSSNSVVQWSVAGTPQALPTSFVNSSQVTALVPANLIASPGNVLVSVLNPATATSSNLVPFAISPPGLPTITQIDPATAVAGSPSVTITITGTNFVSSAAATSIVQWNSGSGPQALTTGFLSTTQLTAVVPAALLTAAGTAFVTVQNPDKSTSNASLFTVTAAGQPNINALSPPSAVAGAPSFQLTVNGANFVNGATVQWNAGGTAQALTTSFVSSTQVTALVPANLLTTAGPVFVVVQNPDKGTSNQFQFLINSAASPTISALNPPTVTAGAPAFQLVVTGSNFVSTSVVQWNNGSSPQPLVTSFVNATQLTAAVPANLVATAGTVFISVANPLGVVSSLVPFTINAPGQVTINALSPSAAPAGSPTLTMTVSGTNFVNGAVVQWNPGSGLQPLTTGFISTTSLTAVVPAALLAAVGTATVTVQNPDKSQSNPLLFTVNASAQPNINALNPSSETAGDPAFQLTVNGVNFVSGAVVEWVAGAGAPQALSTNFTSATQLTALVPANLIASAGTVFIVVQNPDKGTSNQFPFTINPPPQPTIRSLSPAQTNSGGPSLQLTVNGTNYVNGSVVQWNNGGTAQPLATTLVSATQLVAVVPANLTAAAGNVFVTVTNPSGAASAPATFAINTPGQATITLNPSEAVAGSPTTTISVAGSGFQSGAVVQWNGGAGPQPLTTGFVSSTALTAVVPSSLLTAVGTAFVTVLNPDKSTTTAAQFSIIAAPQAVIFQLSPSSTTAGDPGFQLTIDGNNFSSNSEVQWTVSGTPQTLPTSFVNSSQLTALVPANLIAAPGNVLVSVLNPTTATSSNLVPFAVSPPGLPTITQINPATAVAGSPQVTITITGTNFVSSAAATSVVQWNSGSGPQALTTGFLSSTQLTAVVPAALLTAAGTAFITVQNPDKSTSNASLFTVTAAGQPNINALSPPTAVAGAPAFQLTVNGANFVIGATVQWNAGGTAQALTTSFVNSTQLTALVPASLLTTAGPVFVVVQNPDKGTSNQFQFLINSAVSPTISALNPAAVTSGAPAFQLIVTGSNFVSTSVVQWNNGSSPQPLATSFVNSTQLTAAVPANLVAAAGTVFISVANPLGVESSLVPFAINPPGQPTLTQNGISPSAAVSGSPTLTLTVSGTNFVQGAVVQWNGGSGNQPLTTGFASSTQLTAVVPASLLAVAGTALVTVQNPDKGTSPAALFTITPAGQPNVSAVNPASVLLGGQAFQLSVTGSNFVNGSTVQWNSASGVQSLVTTFVSATGLTALVPANLITTSGNVFISVSNPPGGVVSNLVPFNIAAPGQPSITGVLPPVASAGSAAITLVLSGANFQPGAVVQWNGGSGPQPLTTGFVNAGQLSAVVPGTLLATAGTAFLTVLNPDKGSSAAFVFTINPPAQLTITQLQPATVTAGGPSVQVTITGSNFVNGAVAQWNAGGTPQALATSFISASQLTAVVPATLTATAANVFISVMNPGGAVSNLTAFTITVPGAPTIAAGGLGPSSAVAAGPAVTLTVTGTNYYPTSVIQWNSGSGPQPLTTGYISGTQLTALIPATDLATPLTAFVTVLNPDKTVSNTAQFIVSAAPPPTILANGGLNPPTVPAGNPSFQLSITGTNFVNGAIVQWNGGTTPQQLTTAFVSATSLTALVPASLVANPNNVLISVMNPSGVNSNLVSFSITAPGQATISTTGGLNPSSAPAGSPGVALTVTGTNFMNGSIVQWNSGAGQQALTTGFVNATTLNALIPAGFLTTPGTAFVSVLNPDKTTSTAASFQITGSIPVLTSLSQNEVAAGTPGISLNVLGTGFPAGATVLWNSAPVPTTVNSPTQVTAVISTALLSKPGAVLIQVQSGAGLSNSLTFTVSGPAIALLSPGASTSGGPGFVMTVAGTDFLSGATVYWNTAPLTTTFVSSTQLTAVVPAGLVAAPGSFNVSVTNPGGAVSAAVPFAVGAAPTITTISPATAPPGSPGVTLTVNGTNFASGDTVQWNGVGLSTTFVSATQLTAAVPATLMTSSGAVNVSVLHVGGVVSNSVVFNLAAPGVTTLAPSSIAAGSGSFPMTITGISFLAGSQVQWNGTPLPTIFVSATQLTAQVDTSLIQTPGTSFVTVVNGTSQSAGAKFTVNGPTLASLNPTTAVAGGTSPLALTLTGTNFVNGSSVLFNGTPVPATFGSATQLTSQIPAALTASPGTAVVSVTNPGGSMTAPQTMMLTAPPAAAISGLTPPSAVAGGPALQLTVTGTGFVSGSNVQWNGVGLPTSFVSATQMTALVDSSLLAIAGSANVSMQNPGSPVSPSIKFFINGPTITTITPNNAAAGAPGFSITVVGTNFLPGSAVQWNSTSLPTSYNSGTQLTATVPASFITSAGTASVTVQNPGGTVSPAAIFTIGPFTLTITTTKLQDGVVGQSYSQIVSASGGSTPYTWAVSAGTLPQGLNLDPNTGTLSGSPAAAANTSLGLSVTDSVGRTTSKIFPFLSVLPLVITSASPLPLATWNASYSTTLLATGGTPPYIWSMGGTPPAGFNINSGTGEISGVPTNPGKYLANVTVTDSRQLSTPKTFQIGVTVGGVTIGIPDPLPAAQQQRINFAFSDTYNVDLSGTLSLSFASDVGGGDPTIQFSTGGNTSNFTLPATTSQVLYGKATDLYVTSGTLAGTLTVKAAVKTPSGDVTPSPVPSTAVHIAKAPPVITSASLTKVTGGVSVSVTGYSTTREITQATFHFNAAPGSNLTSSDLNVPVTTLFNSWYQNPLSSSYGSLFMVSFPFAIQGDTSAIGSVTITLTNSQGVSQSFTTNLQ